MSASDQDDCGLLQEEESERDREKIEGERAYCFKLGWKNNPALPSAKHHTSNLLSKVKYALQTTKTLSHRAAEGSCDSHEGHSKCHEYFSPLKPLFYFLSQSIC